MAQGRGVQVSRDVAVRLCKEHFLLELLLAEVPWQGGRVVLTGLFLGALFSGTRDAARGGEGLGKKQESD